MKTTLIVLMTFFAAAEAYATCGGNTQQICELRCARNCLPCSNGPGWGAVQNDGTSHCRVGAVAPPRSTPKPPISVKPTGKLK